MELLFVWLIFGIAASVVANHKGDSGALWSFIRMLLGPIGLLLTFLSGPDKKICSYCKSKIFRDAAVCPHCKRDDILINEFEKMWDRKERIN